MKPRDLVKVPSLSKRVFPLSQMIYQVILVYRNRYTGLISYLIDMSDDYFNNHLGFIFSIGDMDALTNRVNYDSITTSNEYERSNMEWLIGHRVHWITDRDNPILVGHIE